MSWTLGGLALALLLHSCCAALVMVRRARKICDWHLPYAHALTGQFCVTATGLLAAFLFDLIAVEMGIAEEWALLVLGMFMLATAWCMGQNSVTNWLAQRARGSFYSAATIRRVSSGTTVHVLAWYGGAGVVALAGWWIRDEPKQLADAPQLAAAQPPLPAIPAERTKTGVVIPAGAPAARPARQPGADLNAEQGLRDALGAWAAAWSRRDADAYLAAYARDFRAPDGLSRARWEAQRRQRLAAARFISVSIETDDVSFAEAGKATVRLRQSYRSNLTSAEDRKILRMIREDEHWRILEERSAP